MVAALFATNAPAVEIDRLALGVGALGLRPRDQTDVAVDFEIKSTPIWKGLYLTAGVGAAGDESAWIRSGFGWDLALGERWAVGVTTAAGYWIEGESRDLGYDLEFRSSGEVWYEIRPGRRLGLSISHFSNASISEINPGVEILQLNYSWWLGHKRPR